MIYIKCAYATVITNNYYIEGVLALSARLKHLDSKYPLLVLVSSNVNTEKLSKLNLITIPELALSSVENYFKYTLNKFQVLLLENYDKILFLDADLFPLNNFDNIFNQKMECDILCSPRSSFDTHIHGGMFLVHPNKELFYTILKNDFIEHFKDDEEILEYFFGDKKNFYFSECRYIHFGGIPKYWQSKNFNFKSIIQGSIDECYEFFNYFNKERN